MGGDRQRPPGAPIRDLPRAPRPREGCSGGHPGLGPLRAVATLGNTVLTGTLDLVLREFVNSMAEDYTRGFKR